MPFTRLENGPPENLVNRQRVLYVMQHYLWLAGIMAANKDVTDTHNPLRALNLARISDTDIGVSPFVSVEGLYKD